MRLNDDSTDELATQLGISAQGIEEAIRRGLLSFVDHRNFGCWRFGDSRNASFRRVDGQPFRINNESVKAESETRGAVWHHLIGLDDVLSNDWRDIVLTPEGSKDALAAFHFAHAEKSLSRIGIVAGLGSAINLLPEDVDVFGCRRVRIIGDVDQAGMQVGTRIAESLVPVAAEVQIFSLAGLKQSDGTDVKDLFDVTRIDYDDFEANRDLWSVTDLDTRGEGVRIIKDRQDFFSSSLPLHHVFPESHGFPVYPVSNSQELEKELEELATDNACMERGTARVRRWQLARDVIAIEKRISRKLNPDELMPTFNKWYGVSQPYLDPKKTRDVYLAKFLAELGKVRVATGEGDALKKAVERVSTLSVSELPAVAYAAESWQRVAALHRELARQSANGAYFLSCRDAARAHPSLNKDSASIINRALVRLGVVSLARLGQPRPGGNASEFRYILPY